MKNIVPIVIGVVVLGAVGVWFRMNSNSAPAPTITNTVTQQPQAQSLVLTKRTLTPNIVTVTEGDQVAIKVTSDESGEFHVSGYEIENDMTAGTELSFSFTADKAGRYNFELHPKTKGEEGEDIVIGAFVVNPR